MAILPKFTVNKDTRLSKTIITDDASLPTDTTKHYIAKVTDSNDKKVTLEPGEDTFELKSNKSTAIGTGDDVKYPTTKAVKTELDKK